MALELRPNCEYCDKDLPPDASEARICTYECNFCADCVERHLNNVSPIAVAASSRVRSGQRANGGLGRR
jgi:hypothetical protein